MTTRPAVSERVEGGTERLAADAAGGAQFAHPERRGRSGQRVLDALRGRESGSVGHAAAGAVSVTRRASGSAQSSRMRSSGARGGAVLDAQAQAWIAAAQVEIGVAPGVEFGAAAQRLAGA